ncbi:MAG: class I SAM-dependent methyltransferase [Actinobacteria bacterium]|nr:class I SAM-dependent methyltransferase [Actinomycetota bacterium]
MDAGPVAGDTRLQTRRLEDLREAVNYRRWLAALALPWLGDDALEIGSGLGDHAAGWSSLGVRITASEADPSRLDYLRSRFDGDARVQVRELRVPIDVTAGHSAVVAMNVLEHIEDDVQALRSFRGLVRAGGHVVILVPAFPFAFSRFDAEIGHFRRYRRGSLRAAMEAADLDVVHIRYVNSVGLIAWFISMRLLRTRPKSGATLRLYDRIVVPLVRRVEQRAAPPFGQSLLAVGRRNARP